MKILFVKTKLSNRTLGGVDYSLCEPLESKHSSQLCCGEVLSKSIALSSWLGVE